MSGFLPTSEPVSPSAAMFVDDKRPPGKRFLYKDDLFINKALHSCIAVQDFLCNM